MATFTISARFFSFSLFKTKTKHPGCFNNAGNEAMAKSYPKYSFYTCDIDDAPLAAYDAEVG